jgi:hypothetical protein
MAAEKREGVGRSSARPRLSGTRQAARETAPVRTLRDNTTRRTCAHVDGWGTRHVRLQRHLMARRCTRLQGQGHGRGEVSISISGCATARGREGSRLAGRQRRPSGRNGQPQPDRRQATAKPGQPRPASAHGTAARIGQAARDCVCAWILKRLSKLIQLG